MIVAGRRKPRSPDRGLLTGNEASPAPSSNPGFEFDGIKLKGDRREFDCIELEPNCILRPGFNGIEPERNFIALLLLVPIGFLPLAVLVL